MGFKYKESGENQMEIRTQQTKTGATQRSPKGEV